MCCTAIPALPWRSSVVLVGRTPRSARVPPDPLFARRPPLHAPCHRSVAFQAAMPPFVAAFFLRASLPRLLHRNQHWWFSATAHLNYLPQLSKSKRKLLWPKPCIRRGVVRETLIWDA